MNGTHLISIFLRDKLPAASSLHLVFTPSFLFKFLFSFLPRRCLPCFWSWLCPLNFPWFIIINHYFYYFHLLFAYVWSFTCIFNFQVLCFFYLYFGSIFHFKLTWTVSIYVGFLHDGCQHTHTHTLKHGLLTHAQNTEHMNYKYTVNNVMLTYSQINFPKLVRVVSFSTTEF